VHRLLGQYSFAQEVGVQTSAMAASKLRMSSPSFFSSLRYLGATTTMGVEAVVS